MEDSRMLCDEKVWTGFTNAEGIVLTGFARNNANA